MMRWLSGDKAIPLRADPSMRFLPWIIGVMVYFAVLSVMGGLTAQRLVGSWQASLGEVLTIQVPPPDPAAADEERPAGAAPTRTPLEQVMDILRVTPGIASAVPVSDDAAAAMLEPWLGRAAIADLPLPRLVGVRLIPGSGLDPEALETRLRQVAPGTVVDDHNRWLRRVAAIANAIGAVAVAVAALVAIVAVVSVAFAVRTGLAIHREVIEVLHLIGARDAFVARQFQSHVLRLALAGGFVGTVFAVWTVIAVAIFLAAPDGSDLSGLAGRARLAPAEWAALIVTPILICSVAALAARHAVLRTLAGLP